MKSILCVALAVALAVPALAGASEEDPVAEVSLRFNPDAMPLTDVVGDQALHAFLDVTNLQERAIALLVVRAPEGAAFAKIQEPAVGWVTKATATSVEFVGLLEEGAQVVLSLRIVDSTATRNDDFEVFVHTIQMDLAMSLTTPLEPLTKDAGAYTCQLVFMSNVDDAMTFLPVSTLGTSVDSTGQLLAAVYDPEYRTYVDPTRVTGEVLVSSVGFAMDDLAPIPLGSRVNAPFVDTAVGPILTLPGSSAQVPAATLWGVTGESRAWFEQHPGGFLLSATVLIDGASVCVDQPYSFAASISPDVVGSAPTPLVLVPPELDSDGDGYPNAAEVRANSNPLLFLSTPYTDDDGDGVPNGRDLVPVRV